MTDLDDRMQLAVGVIDLRRREAGKKPMSCHELAALRDPLGWRAYLSATALLLPGDFSPAEALLAEWHAWHGGA